MMLKGKTFTEADLPRTCKLGEEQRKAYLARQTEKYRIVAVDPANDMPIIAEELDQRALNKLSPKARRVATMMLFHMDEDTRVEVLRAFKKDGSLNYPFDMVD